MSRPEIVLVVARADNGVIGRDGTLPWRIPADLRHFRALTLGTPMVMGRKTFESLPGMLPDRQHVVMTRDPAWHAPGTTVVGNVDQAIAAAGDAAQLSVIGGAAVYALFLPLADRIELTEVHADVDGDTVMPAIPSDEWRETARETLAEGDGVPAISFVTLNRR
jgi:dihydrofolate reductase